MARVMRVWAFRLVLAVLMVWSLFPLWYALVTSMSTDTQLFQVHYLPPQLYWGNYIDLFHRSDLPRGMLNSLIVAGLAVVLALGIGVMAAYPLARLQMALRRPLLLAIIATSFFPQIAVIAGYFELVRRIGLYNSLIAVVVGDLVLLLNRAGFAGG